MTLLTIPAAASSLGVSRRTLDREIAAGMLPVVRIRGARRVAEDDLQQYIADRINACDEPGCTREATCGFPTPSGYRRTCGEHMQLQSDKRDR